VSRGKDKGPGQRLRLARGRLAADAPAMA